MGYCARWDYHSPYRRAHSGSSSDRGTGSPLSSASQTWMVGASIMARWSLADKRAWWARWRSRMRSMTSCSSCNVRILLGRVRVRGRARSGSPWVCVPSLLLCGLGRPCIPRHLPVLVGAQQSSRELRMAWLWCGRRRTGCGRSSSHPPERERHSQDNDHENHRQPHDKRRHLTLSKRAWGNASFPQVSHPSR